MDRVSQRRFDQFCEYINVIAIWKRGERPKSDIQKLRRENRRPIEFSRARRSTAYVPSVHHANVLLNGIRSLLPQLSALAHFQSPRPETREKQFSGSTDAPPSRFSYAENPSANKDFRFSKLVRARARVAEK